MIFNRRHIRLLIFLISAPLLTLAQQSVNFSSFTNADEVVVGDYFEVSFTLENVKGKDFEAPDFEGFDIVSGPNQAMSTTNINGRWSRKLTYSFGLIAKKPGTYTIGPARIEANGKTMRTDPLEIKVYEPANRREDVGGPDAGTENYFLKTNISHDTAYIGQQIVVEYVLYTRVGIEQYNVLNIPDFEGFFVQNVRADGRARRQILNGVDYTTKVLRRYAVFPQEIGEFEINPMTMQLGIATRTGGRFSFQLNVPIRRENIFSESFDITVLPLPPGAPESFNGSVGQFEMGARVRNPIISTDDALTLEMDLRGNGDSKRLMAPDLPLDTLFEVYKPNLIDENVYSSAGRLKTEKTFEYQLLPRQEGSFVITPEFSYFDPDDREYKVLTADSIPIRILPSAMRSGQAGAASLTDDTEDQLRPLMTAGEWEHRKVAFFGKPAFWAMAGLPFLLLFTTIYVRRKQLAWAMLDPRIKRQQQAGKISDQRLKRAKSYLEQVAAAEFYDEIHKALLGYISDKYGIPASEFDRPAIRQALSERGVATEQVDAFIQLLDQCEMALFARLDQADKMQEVYDQAKDLIDRWEKGIE